MSLDNKEISLLFQTAAGLERNFCCPLEIECGIENTGKVIVFETRPLGSSSLILENNINDITLSLGRMKRNGIQTVYLNSENNINSSLSAKILREEGFIVKSL